MCFTFQFIYFTIKISYCSHEIVNINLKDKPDWYVKKHPAVARVPLVEYNGKLMWESGICADYIDELFPEIPLHPKDPYTRNLHRILADSIPKVCT